MDKPPECGEMEDECSVPIREVVVEVRDLLKDIDQKLSHLIEQNRTERQMLFGRGEERWFGGDEDD